MAIFDLMEGKRYKQDNKTAMEAARKELAEKIVQVGAKTLTNLEQIVLTQVLLEGKSFAEIADQRQLTSGRIKQVFQKGIRRLNHFLSQIDEKLGHYNKVIENHADLEKRVAKYEKEEELRKTKKNIIESFPPEIQKLLQTKIEDADLSARVKNICQKGDVFGRNIIETMADLVKLTPKELLKFRNCGKNSIAEIEEFFSKTGLKWGMLIGC